MLHITQELFDSVFNDPHAHVTNIDNIGLARVDLIGHQPPFVGVILSLRHREVPAVQFQQFFHLSDELVPELISMLSDMANFIRAEQIPPGPNAPKLF